MTAQMQRDLDQLTRAVDTDHSIGAVVLTGEPPDRYIAHFDIGDMLDAAERAGRPVSEPVTRTIMRRVEAAQRISGARGLIEASPIGGIYNVSRFNEVVLRIMRSPAIYLAAINGPCGGGCELSVCLDVRIAAASTTAPDEVHRQSVAKAIVRGYQPPADGRPSEHVPTRRAEAQRRFADLLELAAQDA